MYTCCTILQKERENDKDVIKLFEKYNTCVKTQKFLNWLKFLKILKELNPVRNVSLTEKSVDFKNLVPHDEICVVSRWRGIGQGQSLCIIFRKQPVVGIRKETIFGDGTVGERPQLIRPLLGDAVHQASIQVWSYFIQLLPRVIGRVSCSLVVPGSKKRHLFAVVESVVPRYFYVEVLRWTSRPLGV